MIKALNLVSIKRENSLSMIELHPSNMGRNDEATQKYNSYCTQYTSGRSPRMPTNHGNKCRYFVLWSFWLVKITSSTLKLARTSKFYPFYKQTRWKIVLTVRRVTARFAKWDPSGNDDEQATYHISWSHSPDIPNDIEWIFRPSLCCLISIVLRGQTELPGEGSHSN